MNETYQNPLCRRYASREMQEIFSDARKFSTWRRLWVALAESEQELGLPITDAQIAEMKAHLDDIDYAVADQREREVRHDVMAHIYAYGVACPAAQPTTVGKRATLWLQDLMMDLEHLDFVLGNLRLLGCRGTTGTGASFLELFEGDSAKVLALEKKIAHKMGFSSSYAVSGQTYTRKVDYFTLSVLSGIAQSAQKFSGDIRLLSHLKEVDEPFESGQVGSSAMAYKRNPMRSERISSLARFIIADALNPAMTAGTQWLERTLDDSANRRISIPEAFLAADGILSLYINVISGLTVYPRVMEKHLAEELPFMATENILMHCVRAGGDRQTLHEAIRRHSVAAGKAVKQDGAPNDLLDRVAADPVFGLTRAQIDGVIRESRLTGRAAEQTEEYLAEVRRVLAENADAANEQLNIKINV